MRTRRTRWHDRPRHPRPRWRGRWYPVHPDRSRRHDRDGGHGLDRRLVAPPLAEAPHRTRTRRGHDRVTPARRSALRCHGRGARLSTRTVAPRPHEAHGRTTTRRYCSTVGGRPPRRLAEVSGRNTTLLTWGKRPVEYKDDIHNEYQKQDEGDVDLWVEVLDVARVGDHDQVEGIDGRDDRHHRADERAEQLGDVTADGHAGDQDGEDRERDKHLDDHVGNLRSAAKSVMPRMANTTSGATCKLGSATAVIVGYAALSTAAVSSSSMATLYAPMPMIEMAAIIAMMDMREGMAHATHASAKKGVVDS